MRARTRLFYVLNVPHHISAWGSILPSPYATLYSNDPYAYANVYFLSRVH